LLSRHSLTNLALSISSTCCAAWDTNLSMSDKHVYMHVKCPQVLHSTLLMTLGKAHVREFS
jgi:hypothetical protein